MKEIEIPEGYEAKIKDNKVIFIQKESDDERVRKDIIRLIQGGGYVSGKVKEEMLSYLEKQKEQKPAEWSEEDEAAFGDLMWCIEQASKFAKDENDMGNIWFAENWVKNRLKFISPQHITYALDAPLAFDKDMNPIYPPINHWKPSEEQMEALDWAANSINSPIVGFLGYNFALFIKTLKSCRL